MVVWTSSCSNAVRPGLGAWSKGLTRSVVVFPAVVRYLKALSGCRRKCNTYLPIASNVFQDRGSVSGESFISCFVCAFAVKSVLCLVSVICLDKGINISGCGW